MPRSTPVIIALGVFYDGTPREYRVAMSKARALRWLRSHGWKITMAVAGARPHEAAYAERAVSQEWARVIAAPLVGLEAPDAP